MQQNSREALEKEDRQRRATFEKRWNRICPPLFKDTDEKRLPKQLLRTALSWRYGPEGLLFEGSTGLAKTRCMFLLLKRLVFEGVEVKYFAPCEFEHLCISEYQNGNGPEWLAQVRDADIVFFDDLLKSKITPRVETEFFSLIDYRYTHELPILATTNWSTYQLQQQFGNKGEPFVRRLLEMVQVVSAPLAGDPT